MEKNINWDNYEETNYINEAGTYTLKVVSYETGTTQNGKEYHKYVCETQDKQKINLSLYLVENAMWKYKLFVKALGLDAKGNVNLDELPKLLIGRKFKGVVRKQPDKIDIVTGMPVESKYYEIASFSPIEE